MMRWDIINSFIKKHGYKSYLEVGAQNTITGNFSKIDIEKKVSIDPYPPGPIDFKGTSDEYFNQLNQDVKFDIIFIDGLHHYDQVLIDIENSLKHLSFDGVIVCHDCLPSTEKMQLREDSGGEWTGDVWKAIAILNVSRTDLQIDVVDTDYGCGIIRRGSKIPHTPVGDYLNYPYYTEHKNELLNVISPMQFIEKYIHSKDN